MLGRKFETGEEKRKAKEAMLEYKYFSFYCGGNWGLAINEKLRNGNTEIGFSEQELAQMQTVMDKRLNQSYIPEKIIGYRFLNYNNLCASLLKRRIIPGMIIIDKGYMGVGLVKNELAKEFATIEEEDTLLEVMIPRGANALYVDLISCRENEQEVLFARNSKMRVLSVYKRKKRRVIICKYVL